MPLTTDSLVYTKAATLASALEAGRASAAYRQARARGRS